MSYGRPFRGLATPRCLSKWLGVFVANTSIGASEEVESGLSQLEKPAVHPWLGVCSPQSVIFFLHTTIKKLFGCISLYKRRVQLFDKLTWYECSNLLLTILNTSWTLLPAFVILLIGISNSLANIVQSAYQNTFFFIISCIKNSGYLSWSNSRHLFYTINVTHAYTQKVGANLFLNTIYNFTWSYINSISVNKKIFVMGGGSNLQTKSKLGNNGSGLNRKRGSQP